MANINASEACQYKFKITEKTCPICKVKKTVDEFDTYFSKERNKRRIQNYCKSCQPEVKTKRSKEYYENHKEERLQYSSDYRNNPDNKVKIVAVRKKCKQAARDELKEYMVVDYISQKFKVKAIEVRQTEGLTDLYRANLLLKRKIKQKKNEK